MRRTTLLLALALSSCSLFGGGGAEVEATYLFPSAEVSDGLDFGVSVDIDGRTRTLGRADFRPVGDRQFNAAPLTVGDGPSRVTCSVARGGAESTVSVDIDVEDRFLYRVSCAVASHNPIRLCFGCRGSEAAPLDPALGLPADDSLFVVWGGDSIDHPVDY